MSSGIYAIESQGAGKVYIGSALDFDKRLHQHNTDLRRGCHTNVHLQRVSDKYGDLEFVEVERVRNPKNLIKREQAWLDTMLALAPAMLMNFCHKAGSNLGRTWMMNPEAVAKGVLARTGLKRSAATRLKMSAAQKGRRKTKEQQERNRQAALHRWRDPEIRSRYIASAANRSAATKRDAQGRWA